MFHEANTSLVERERKLDDAAEMIETEMDLIGATAIEDKLQVTWSVGVPYLQCAGQGRLCGYD